MDAEPFDPWEVLGVPEGATQAEIRKAYRAKARDLHADKGGEDEAAMQQLNHAREIASDPEKAAAWRAGVRDLPRHRAEVEAAALDVFFAVVGSRPFGALPKDIFEECREAVRDGRERFAAELQDAERAEAWWVRIQRRVKRKDGEKEDPLLESLKSRIQGAQEAQRSAKHRIAASHEVEALFDRWADSGEMALPGSHWHGFEGQRRYIVRR